MHREALPLSCPRDGGPAEAAPAALALRRLGAAAVRAGAALLLQLRPRLRAPEDPSAVPPDAPPGGAAEAAAHRILRAAVAEALADLPREAAAPAAPAAAESGAPAPGKGGAGGGAWALADAVLAGRWAPFARCVERIREAEVEEAAVAAAAAAAATSSAAAAAPPRSGAGASEPPESGGGGGGSGETVAAAHDQRTAEEAVEGASGALQRALRALGWLDAAEALEEAGAMSPLWRGGEEPARVRAGRAALEAAAKQVAPRAAFRPA